MSTVRSLLRFSLVALPSLLLALASPAAHALGVSFGCISNNSATDCAIAESQLVVEITDAGGGQVAVGVSNVGPEPVVFTRILFQGRLFDSIADLVEQPPSVDFAVVDPKNFPAGNSIAPRFQGDLEATANNPMPHLGVGVGESLGLLLDLAGGVDFGDVVAALASGELRMGVKAQAFESGGSETLVSFPVPEPVSVLLLAGGMAALAAKRRPLRPG